jgi:WhiB family redox-sensing transcriptional regulator
MTATTLVKQKSRTAGGIPPSNVAPSRWQDDAGCLDTDPEAFFPSDSDDSLEIVQTALAVCENCAVIRECLATAVADNNDWGVWGGLDQNARRELIAKHRRRGVNRAALAELLLRGGDGPT